MVVMPLLGLALLVGTLESMRFQALLLLTCLLTGLLCYCSMQLSSAMLAKSVVDPNPAVGVASLILVRFLCYYALDC
uniref:Uncharacterized protein n=1 Tax=Populus trichocarpa TaxID=3694 RepID=B9HMQ4_POPTR